MKHVHNIFITEGKAYFLVVCPQGKVDGVDYNKLMMEAIYLDRNQTISSSLVSLK